MPNTCITYMYRDGMNFKYCHETVVEGNITFADVEPFLDEGRYFTPTDVGLYHPGDQAQGWPLDDVDHAFCEIHSTDFRPCTEDAACSKQEFLALLQAAKEANFPAQHQSLTDL